MYIHEISVAYEAQKQGIGRRLMLTVLDFAQNGGYSAIGLTTRRDARWNMPFYQSLGFIETRDAQVWPDLFARLENEVAQGANPAIRCAMVRMLQQPD